MYRKEGEETPGLILEDSKRMDLDNKDRHANIQLHIQVILSSSAPSYQVLVIWFYYPRYEIRVLGTYFLHRNKLQCKRCT